MMSSLAKVSTTGRLLVNERDHRGTNVGSCESAQRQDLIARQAIDERIRPSRACPSGILAKQGLVEMHPDLEERAERASRLQKSSRPGRYSERRASCGRCRGPRRSLSPASRFPRRDETMCGVDAIIPATGRRADNSLHVDDQDPGRPLRYGRGSSRSNSSHIAVSKR